MDDDQIRIMLVAAVITGYAAIRSALKGRFGSVYNMFYLLGKKIRRCARRKST